MNISCSKCDEKYTYVTPEFQTTVSEYFGIRIEQALKELMEFDACDK